VPIVSLQAASKALGFASRTTLQRLRREGRLGHFDCGSAGLELEGLAEHLAAELKVEHRGNAAPRKGAPGRSKHPASGGDSLPPLTREQRLGLTDAQLRARVKLLAIKSETARLELAKLQGTVVEAAEMRAALFGLVRRLRDQLELLPRSIGPGLVGLDGPAIEARMAAGIRQALGELAGGIATISPPDPRQEAEPDLVIGPDGAQLAHPWPAPPPPTTLAATFRVFDWGPGEVGPWRANTEAERAARQAAWNNRPR
jgi:hypothetical protein